MADLWVQDRLRTSDFELAKVAGADNVADLMTKYLDRPVHERHVQALGLEDEAGRATSAAKIGATVVACCLSRFHSTDSDEDLPAEEFIPW